MQTQVIDRYDGSRVASPRHRQRDVALSNANGVRLARASRKRRLANAASPRAALVLAARWVARPPDELHTISIEELILSCRGVGTALCAELLDSAGLTGGVRLGNGTPQHGALTPRQQRVLAGVLLDSAGTAQWAA